jgi:signal transduction histidine kinase
MRERAEVIGAELEIESAPDEGTVVTVTVPL